MVTRRELSVLLVGEESAGVQLLKALARRGERILGVLASSDRTRASGLSAAARQMGITTWPAELVSDPRFGDYLRTQGVDVILNAHSLHLFHPCVLAAPRIGCWNIHPGLLPQYAGLNTVSWAICKGETRFGVTVHEMTARIDAGRIAYQESFPIDDNDTPLSLMTKCVQKGLGLVLQLLDTAATNAIAIPRVQQDISRRRYFGRDIPENGRICWDRPAKQVFNLVRCFDYRPFSSPWGHPKAWIGTREIEILKVLLTGQQSAAPPGTVGTTWGERATVACTDEWLVVHTMRANGEAVPSGSFLQSGDRLFDRPSNGVCDV